MSNAKKPKMNAAAIVAASPELHPNYDPDVAESLRQDTQEVLTELRQMLSVVGPALQQLGRDLPAALEGIRTHAQTLQGVAQRDAEPVTPNPFDEVDWDIQGEVMHAVSQMVELVVLRWRKEWPPEDLVTLLRQERKMAAVEFGLE